jgi:hypothetical protein
VVFVLLPGLSVVGRHPTLRVGDGVAVPARQGGTDMRLFAAGLLAAASLAAVDAAGLIVPVAVGVGSAYVVVLAVGVGRRQ